MYIKIEIESRLHCIDIIAFRCIDIFNRHRGGGNLLSALFKDSKNKSFDFRAGCLGSVDRSEVLARIGDINSYDVSTPLLQSQYVQKLLQILQGEILFKFTKKI